MCCLKRKIIWLQKKGEIEKGCYNLLEEKKELKLSPSCGYKFYHAKFGTKEQPVAGTPLTRTPPLDERDLWGSSGNQGRFNQRQIKYPYVALDELTAVAEVRALWGATITVGVYTLKRDLRILDATRINSQGFLTITGEEFITNLCASPCYPPQDSLIYDACNLSADIIRSAGYDGIIWSSSRRYGGQCIVFFKDKKQQLFERMQEILNKEDIYIGRVIECQHKCNHCFSNLDFASERIRST